VPTKEREEQAQRTRLAEVDAWLAECDAVAESIEGEFDSAKDLRQIREERASRLWWFALLRPKGKDALQAR
jgi:hypothetical protein